MSSREVCRNWQKPDESQTALTICTFWDSQAISSVGRPGFTTSPAVWSAPMALVQ